MGDEGGVKSARTHLSLETELQGEKQKQNQRYVSVRRHDFHERVLELKYAVGCEPFERRSDPMCSCQETRRAGGALSRT